MQTRPGHGVLRHRGDRASPDCDANLGAKALVFPYAVFGNEWIGHTNSGVSRIGGSDLFIAVSFEDDDGGSFTGAVGTY